MSTVAPRSISLARRHGRTMLALPVLRRAALLGGCVLAMSVAFAAGRPEALLAADPELATLLRGMALIKAGLVAGALALLWWRLARPL